MKEESAQGTPVDALYEDQLSPEHIVDATASLREVVERLSFRDEVQAVYALDTRDRYVGIVTERTLLEWLRHNLAEPGALDRATVSTLARATQDAQAQEAVHPRSGELPVEPHEPAMHALRSMLSASLVVVPVVSADGSLLGDIRLTRLLRAGDEGS